MSNSQDCRLLCDIADGSLNNGIGFIVNGGSGFIKNNNLCFTKDGSNKLQHKKELQQQQQQQVNDKKKITLIQTLLNISIVFVQH